MSAQGAPAERLASEPPTNRVFGASLRGRLLLILLPALIAIAILAAAFRYVVAQDNAERLFDRTLLAVAHAVSRDVLLSEGDLLTEELLESLTTALGDQVYYHVRGPRGEFITGYASPPEAPVDLREARGAPVFFAGDHYGALVRVVAMQEFIEDAPVSDWVTVTVWQTVRERQAMSLRLALSGGAQMLMIIIAAGAVLWVGVAWALRPLNGLRDAVARRSLDDLSTIQRPTPKEARPLVAAMNALFQRLSGALAAREALISNAAHQLRNPIAALQAQAEAAAMTRDPEALRQRLGEVVAASRHASRLTTQLLSMERASARAFDDAVRVDLAKVAQDVAAARAPGVMGRGVEFSFEVRGAPAPVIGQPVMISEAIENLIDNALRYGEGAPIRVIAAFDPGQARVTVENDGPPVPPDQREAIFDRFVRGEDPHGPGCGLGLAIVREITAAHSGHARCLDQDDGAAFEIALPLAPAQSAAAPV